MIATTYKWRGAFRVFSELRGLPAVLPAGGTGFVYTQNVSVMKLLSAPSIHGESTGAQGNIAMHTSNVGCSRPVLNVLSMEVYPAIEVGVSIASHGPSHHPSQRSTRTSSLEARIALVPPSAYFPNRSTNLHSPRPSAQATFGRLRRCPPHRTSADFLLCASCGLFLPLGKRSRASLVHPAVQRRASLHEMIDHPGNAYIGGKAGSTACSDLRGN